MLQLSLRNKLLLSFAALLALCLLAPGLYVLHALPPDVDAAGIRQELVLVAGLCLGLSSLLAFLLTRGFLRSLSSIAAAARDIGQGDLQRRISLPPGKEFREAAESLNWMAERTRRQMDALSRQNETLEAVLDAMWDGVLILDRKGCVLAANRSMSDIQPDVEKRLGRKPLEAIPSNEFQQACQEVLGLDEKCSRSLTIELHGRVFEVNVVRSARAPDLGAVAVFHDVSEQHRLDMMRQDFVANVSHELRTPLTSVKGYAETLLSDKPPPPRIASNFLGVILRNANHMAKMVDDLLSLSRLDAGKEPVKARPVRPGGALLTAWEACSSLAESKSVRLARRFPEPDVPVMADPDQLVRVFRNLLENAVKFSPENSEITAVADVLDQTVRFAILDPGPGIPKKDQPRVFERFYSVQKHRTNEPGSTGLGLAICRRIVGNHGGDIWLESPPRTIASQSGAKTAFMFTLPVAGDEPQSSS